MLIQVIAAGAGGMKAVIDAINNEVITQEQTLFINSTLKDVPQTYRSNTVIFSDDGLGCAKNRVRARKMVVDAIQSGKLNLDKWVDPNANTVVLVTSTDGGSGSGSVPVIADYIYNFLNKKVHIIALDGFDTDVNGYKNRVDFFKEMSENYTYECICNSKYLSESDGDMIKAEHLANVELATRLIVLQGSCIIESDHNVDEADLMKTVLTPGFMDIHYKEFPGRLKNIQEFNAMLKDICDSTKSFDVVSPSQKRMAVIINHNATDTSAFDWKFDILKERYGAVDNIFIHLQESESAEFIAIINAGMNMPADAIEDIYKKYTIEKNKVNRAKDSFFDSTTKYDTDDDDDDDAVLYDNAKTMAKSKSKFFGAPNAGKFVNTEKKGDNIDKF